MRSDSSTNAVWTEALIGGLRAEQIEFTAEEVADILWLWAVMPHRVRAPKPDSSPPPHDGPKETASSSEQKPGNLGQAPPRAAADSPATPGASEKPGAGELLTAAGPTGGSAGGVPFRVPAAVALPGALDLTRALRPLMKRIASRRDWSLDEQATVDCIAEQRIWVPVTRPAFERWLEIALVTEESFEMRPWGRTIQEFQRLLAHSGAFRDVRAWRLVSANGGWQLHSGGGTAARRPQELIDAAGRRVVLIVSDCSSPLWRDQVFCQTLKLWGARQPVAVIQMLPQKLWASTILLDTRAVRVRSPRPGGPNAKFVMEAATRRQSAASLSGIGVPIVTLEKPSLAAWASTTAAVGGASAHARLFPPIASTPAISQSTEQAWEHFEKTALPVTQDLARQLAAAPLTLPIMRLVQRTMLPDSKQVHLAEIFRSELIYAVEDSNDPELVRYDFKPGIRSRLLDTAKASESVLVLRAALTEFIGARAGQSLDFLAILRDPNAAGEFALGPEAQPFAQIASQVLARMGGRYRALAARLENFSAPPPAEHPVLTGKAAISWSVYVFEVDSPTLEDLRTTITEGLRNAGHTVVSSPFPDAVVLIGRSDNPFVGDEDIESIEISVSGSHPNKIDFSHPARWQSGFEQLLRKLDQLRKAGVISGVPELPEIYVRRQEVFQTLADWCFSGFVVGHLIGPAGSGKRTLAADFARNPRIRRAFAGGIYWGAGSMPEADGPILLIDSHFTASPVAPGVDSNFAASPVAPGVKYLFMDRPYLGDITARLISVPDLSDEEQEQIAEPCRMPQALRTPALKRVALLARWKRILLNMSENRVLAWLDGKKAPAEYGTDAERFSIQCALDLLPVRIQDALQRLGCLESDGELPEELSRAVARGSEDLDEAVLQGRALDLVMPGNGIRRPSKTVRDLFLSDTTRQSVFQAVATHYLFMRTALSQDGWSGVPDDGYFLQHIARALFEAGQTTELIALLTETRWLARRIEADGLEALLQDAGLAGMQETVMSLIRDPESDASPNTPIVYVSYSRADEGVERFAQDIFSEAPRPCRAFMRPLPPDEGSEGNSLNALNQASAFLLILSPNYIAAREAIREISLAMERQERRGEAGFVLPVMWEKCEFPPNLLSIQFAGYGHPAARRTGDEYLQIVREVARAVDRLANARVPLGWQEEYTNPARLTSVAETHGYAALLHELYEDEHAQAIYWTLLNQIRDLQQPWLEWFGRLLTVKVAISAVSENEWHEAMWIVAASLNDPVHGEADPQSALMDLARQRSGLLAMLWQYRGFSAVSRVASYYAFLIDSSLDDVGYLLDLVNPQSEEVRFPKALLPWLLGVRWIAARTEDPDHIERVRLKIDSVQMAIPGQVTWHTDETAMACQNEIHQRIRPWIALAQLANDYVETRERMASGPERTTLMTQVVFKMQRLADAVESADHERLLQEGHAGRRLIAYGLLAERPSPSAGTKILAVLLEEKQPFLQYWGLTALSAVVKAGNILAPEERRGLEDLRTQLPAHSDRLSILRRILDDLKPAASLAGKRILWVDNRAARNFELIGQFRGAGATVESVTDTAAAMSLLGSRVFDLVISEIRVGRNSNAGFDLVRQLRASGNRVSTVYFSRGLNERQRAEADGLGIPSFDDAGALRKDVLEWNFSSVPRRPETWVRVAGTGRASGLLETVQNGAELTGLAVAQAGMGLITGGWAGVDYIAGRAFAEVIEARGEDIDSSLIQMLDGVTQPDLKKGRVEKFERGKGVAGSVERAQAVVLVGGEGGVWEVLRRALERNIPVIPLAASGGDSERAWKLLRVLPGAEKLESPSIALSDRDTALRLGLPALIVDLHRPVELRSGTGLFIVDLITSILPLAAQYMRPVSIEEFERTAARMRDALRRWGESVSTVMEALLNDADREWRVTGYLAFQVVGGTESIPLLLDCLAAERAEIEANREMRPFFQWLNAVDKCARDPELRRALPPDISVDLRSVLTFLEGKAGADPGGQCKNLLRSILGRLSMRVT